jgi:glycosyltransferase involved in cell wall biosynthesis
MYAAMDLLVLPSHREGSGRVLVEAAAMRLPVIASDIRGCREVVSSGKTGILVPPKDSEALCNAILAVAQADDRQRAEWGQAARRRAEEFFDERAVFQRMIAHYRALQGRTSPNSADVTGGDDP